MTKVLLSILSIISLGILLSANEAYPLVEPLAVENAPIKKIAVVAPEPEPEIVEETTNTQEVVKLDTDNDGVFDDDDQCPNSTEGVAVDEKGCELDSDDDGVLDSKDKCPNTSKEFQVDGYGCPQTAILKINFPAGKSVITVKLLKKLKGFAEFLTINVGYQVIIYGHTDSSGTKEHNQRLSKLRADAVKEGLIRYGIDSFRLTSIGKGEGEPIADNKTKEGRTANRRIEVELLQ